MPDVHRRLFLATGIAAGGTLAVPGLSAAGAGTAALRYPFHLGVASGDPRPDRLVLWTRLATAPLDLDGGMGDKNILVEWQLATDEKFANIAASGNAVAVPGEGHSIHAEPRGLSPGTEYFYRFKAGEHISPVGRTRTAPAAGSAPGSLTFAFASCQHFEEGWYHAHRFIAEDEPDLVLFLGDYMYENNSGRGNLVRGYVEFDEVNRLVEHRLRYAQHRLDPDLKAAHAAAPWLPVFDDHELENNWWGVNFDQPERKQPAFQAFWENMPLPRSMKPENSAIPLYRTITWGTLARFHMLDTRQYRWKQAPNNNNTNCGELRRTDRTLIGDAQEKWLLDSLTARDSGWDFLGQQVFFAQRDGDGRASTCDVSEDAWDGYPANRERIVRGWIDRKVRNPVVLTGDVHRHWASDLRLNYHDHDSPVVGTELVTTSITSRGSTTPPDNLDENPHLRYIGHQRGYVRARVTPDQLTAEFMGVSSVLVRDPAQVELSVVKRFHVADGLPGLQPG
ncbi:alkaline phosphatase D family protein [Amycolatopsis cihanbeyliensis]|uniref:Alkaline phosphatase D n=1 Tax=Amycolatopsis cihanbeyliensis TaxID=1128664 RepID=A0A542DRI8_AMYCI|nr:alkaline phosphatase D family protein [Amycolatopsis cihanbeyliensis]TQJ05604.1 alkaline phosphatase D [Amycolatopsis cihanbeyliensis]